ncbi:MAG: hypothetical protein AB7P69_24530 [Candidatus Binatia bacterium]
MSQAYQRSTQWGQRHIPPGLRSVLGILLMGGGILGFLPILGFWMIPLGIGLLALDFPPLRRRLEQWLGHKEETLRRRRPSDARPEEHATTRENAATNKADPKV